jgi:hypothetical protein
MKTLDIPQSGKRGLNVSQAGQFGQISRALAIPSNPRTPSQMGVRTILSRVAARWRVLQEASSSPARPIRARTPSFAPPRWSARAARPVTTSGSSAPVRPPRPAPPTSPASTRAGMACRRSPRRCMSGPTSSLTGGRACPRPSGPSSRLRPDLPPGRAGG